MSLRIHGTAAFCLALVVAWCGLPAPCAAVQVWSGLTLSFSKPDGANGALPENQDVIAPSTAFARGETAGLFNAAAEAGWNGFGPKFTEWATDLVEGNEGQNIFAVNHTNLEFTDWLSAYGGGGDHALHLRLQGRNAVVHLIEEDIYLDLKFSFWSAASSGGGFAYMRAEPPAPVPGDYNGDLAIDAADYTVWRNSFGMEVDEGTGADGVADGIINELDYNFWKTHFGGSPPMGTGSAAILVPEPANLLLLLGGLLIMAGTRKTSPRGPGHFLYAW
jgi:hypothetical protein